MLVGLFIYYLIIIIKKKYRRYNILYEKKYMGERGFFANIEMN
jgi:uncharacterized membrane protein